MMGFIEDWPKTELRERVDEKEPKGKEEEGGKKTGKFYPRNHDKGIHQMLLERSSKNRRETRPR